MSTKVSDRVLEAVLAGESSVSIIANKLEVSKASVLGSLLSLRRRGYIVQAKDDQLVILSTAPNDTNDGIDNSVVDIMVNDEILGVEYSSMHQVTNESESLADENVVEPMVMMVADTEISATKKRGRKMNPNSNRQRAFAIVREMIAKDARRCDIRDRLVSELGIKEGNAGIYIQKVREQLGLVKHANKESVV